MSMKLKHINTSCKKSALSDSINNNNSDSSNSNSNISTEETPKIKEIKSHKIYKQKKTTDFLDYIKDKGIQLKLRYEGEETKTTISDDNQSKDNKTCEDLPKISLQKEYPKTNSKSCSNKSINEQPTNNQNYNSPHPYIMNCAKLFYGYPQCNNLYMNQINSAQYNQMQYMMNNTQTPNINLVSFSQFINTHVKPSFNVNNICIPSQIEQIVTYYQNNDLFLSYQYINLLRIIKKEQVEPIKTEDEKEPQRPFFYHNHTEQVETRSTLALIEYLFSLENLNQDYNLRKLLNEEGYVSVDVLLTKHPQMKKFEITKEKLEDILTEHRINEVTETVETFDGFLIRNKEWIDNNEKFLPIDKVYQNTMALMNRLSMNIKIKTMNTALINNMIKLYNQSMILMQQRKILLDNQLKASSQL